jgi:hypothetical protein
MSLCGLDLEILYACLKNSFAPNFLCDAQLQEVSRTKGMSLAKKKKEKNSSSR